MNEQNNLKEKSLSWKIANSWWLVVMFWAGCTCIVRIAPYIWGSDYFLSDAAYEVCRLNIWGFMIYPVCFGILCAICSSQQLLLLFSGSFFLFANLRILLALDNDGIHGLRALITIMAIVMVLFNVTAGIVFFKPIMNCIAHSKSDRMRLETEKKRQVYFEEAMKEVRMSWKSK